MDVAIRATFLPREDAGATVKVPTHDVGGGRVVATVTDSDGNVIGLIQDKA